MIHVMCPFWRAWHKQMKARTGMQQQQFPDNNLGFVPGRRREEAMLTQMALISIIRRRKMGAVVTLRDGTNAFASTKHEALK
eukprot:1281339-Lingulodinium_polyedra.AAC.1